MYFFRTIVLGIVGILIAVGYPAADALAFYVDQYHYTACMEAVPIRRTPDMSSEQIGTIPKGTAVKVDKEQNGWIRVIYKVPEGYYIGWSLAALLCPLQSRQRP